MPNCMCRKPKKREFDGQGSFKYDPSREKYKHTYKVCSNWLAFVDVDTKPQKIHQNFINIPYTLSLIWYFIQFKSHQVKRLAKHLQGVDDLQSSYNIWHFAKFNVPYEVEKGEQVHSAAVTLRKAAKNLPGDCDDFVVLCGSLLYELNIYFEVVLAGYDKENPKRFTHIFIKIPKSGGEFYIIDPVWSNFEVNQYPAFNKHLIKAEMALGQFEDSFTAGLGQFTSGGVVDMLNGYESDDDLGDYADFELVDELNGGADLIDSLNGDMDDESMDAYLDGYEDALDDTMNGMEDNLGLFGRKSKGGGGASTSGAGAGRGGGGGASGSQIKIGTKNPITMQRGSSSGRANAIAATQRASTIQSKVANLIQTAKTANEEGLAASGVIDAGASGGGAGGAGGAETKTLIAGVPNWMLIAGVIVIAAIAWWAFGSKKKTRRR